MNILFITWTRIGDAVLSTGLLHELTRRHPDARITVVCGPLAETLFANVPGLVRVIALKKRALNAHWFGLWPQIAGTRWDMVVDLRRSLTAYTVRAKQRCILGRTDNTRHRVAWLPEVIGISAPLNPYLWISDAQHAAAHEILGDGGPVLAIAPIAARDDKTWPAARFAQLARVLLNGPCAGWRVLLVAGPNEAPRFQALSDAVPEQQRIVLTGHADLLVVAAALARARLYIGNDSGMTHLAAAAGTPTMALFGPTNPAHYGPWGPQTCVVEAPELGGVRAIDGLDVQTVTAAVTAMLGHTKTAPETLRSSS